MRLSAMGLAAALLATVPAIAWSQTVTVQGPSGAPIALSAEAIAVMPSLHLNVSFKTEHGPFRAVFDGPLLWTVLTAVHAVDPAKPRDAVREVVILTGSDGYTAVLALGEISPAFEGKQVLLADRMDGKSLASGQFRIVVPGDQRGGRNVRDVRSITVRTLAQP